MSRALTVKEELKAIEKGRATSAWYNSTNKRTRDNVIGTMVEPQMIYLGEKGGRPTWSEQVFDVAEFRKQVDAYRQGKVDNDKLTFSPWREGWDDVLNEYINDKNAAVVTNADFSAIDVVNVMAEMVGTDLRDFTLEQAVTVVNTPQIELDIDVYTRFSATASVPEGVKPESKRGSVARTNFALPKDVAAVSITDEAQIKAVHDLYRTHIENAVSDLKRVKANKIATAIESASDVGSADFAAYTTDHSTTSPYDAIGGVADTIISNNGRPDTLASHDKVFRDFIGNTHVKGFAITAIPNMHGAKIITDVPGLPGYTWFVDNEKTATILSVYDKQAFYLAQGPVRTAQYRLEQEGIDGYIVRDWNQIQLVQSGKARDLTSVTA